MQGTLIALALVTICVPSAWILAKLFIDGRSRDPYGHEEEGS